MKLFSDINEWRPWRRDKFFEGKKIGFVPTMGNLHEGHASLLQRSVNENDCTILSIFVNPTQFNQPEDLINYPRTLENDLAIAQKSGVDFVLVPTEKALYPLHYRYQVHETEFSKKMEGEYRPGHFVGVLTIVLKLLMLVKPTRAYFGEKDYQQLQLVREMVEDFFLDIEIIGCPTIRNEQGLALSSRNSRLTEEERSHAANFPKWLQAKLTPEAIRKKLIDEGFDVDYIEEYKGRRFGAVSLNKVRLIDNVNIEDAENYADFNT